MRPRRTASLLVLAATLVAAGGFAATHGGQAAPSQAGSQPPARNDALYRPARKDGRLTIVRKAHCLLSDPTASAAGA